MTEYYIFKSSNHGILGMFSTNYTEPQNYPPKTELKLIRLISNATGDKISIKYVDEKEVRAIQMQQFINNEPILFASSPKQVLINYLLQTTDLNKIEDPTVLEKIENELSRKAYDWDNWELLKNTEKKEKLTIADIEKILSTVSKEADKAKEDTASYSTQSNKENNHSSRKK